MKWKFSGRKTNARIIHVHEGALRIVCRNDYRSNVLINCFKLTNHIVHHKNIQTLAIELHKVKNNLSNQIMQGILGKRYQNLDCNFRFQTDFVLPGVNSTYFGLHSLKSFSSKT